jgi:AraC-type DNA-binding domain-containing proteins
LTFLQFTAPPLPHFTMGGQDTYQPGDTHPSRKNIGLFDVLLVTRGCLFLGEEQNEYEVTPGKVLILRPDLYHYSYKPCTSRTHFYWLHFQTTGGWAEISNETKSVHAPPNDPYQPISFFHIYLPRFCSLANPWTTHQKVETLLELQEAAKSPWQQQVLFQEIMMDLQSGEAEPLGSPSFQIAENIAAFLKQHYPMPITNETLHRQFHYHPTYLARCMKRAFGCTPLEYLKMVRIRQAKNLLLRTELPVEVIASQIGFNSSTYFIRCFAALEKQTPQAFRKRFR